MTPRYARALGLLSVLVMCVVSRPTNGSAPSVTEEARPQDRDAALKSRALEVYGRLPLSFEANRGQTSAQVDFVSRGSGYTLFVTPTEAVFTLRAPGTRPPTTRDAMSSARPGNLVPSATQPTAEAQARVVRMQIVGANATARPEGRDELPGKVNYFIGNDPKRWSRDVPTYARVRYEEVYAGVDLVYYGNQRELEYDFIVAPGADPDTIALTFEGADALEVDGVGNLILHVGPDPLLQRAPRVYQEIDGVETHVPGRYALQHATGGRQRVRFEVGAYDHTRPLVIDPVLAYSSFLGGSRNDSAQGIAVDTDGNAYITGSTGSNDFPIQLGALDTTSGGGDDTFVTKMNADGSALVYSTYLGGSERDTGLGIAVDSAGDAFVTGETNSADFPTTPGAFQPTYGINQDAFVTKLAANGAALLYSSYLGGNGSDWGNGIAVDDIGNAYVGGQTNSFNFPTTPGALDTTFADRTGTAVFVAKVDASGAALQYSTYLGGGGPATDGTADNYGRAIAIDSDGNAYVTGATESGEFPTTPGALDTTLGGDLDVFVTKLNASGTGLVYSTYLGGGGIEAGESIAVDDAGHAYVAGITVSSDFPATPGAFATTSASPGYADAFVTKLDVSGTALAYSTYLGGSFNDEASGIAIDTSGNAYVTGYTQSSDFPTTPGALDRTLSPQPPAPATARDAFVTTIDQSGATLGHSTYLGAKGDNWGLGIALDGARNIYVTGFTTSSAFQTTPGAFDRTIGRETFFKTDAFVVKIAPEPDVDLVQTALSNPPAVVVLTEGFSVTDTVENQGSTPAANSRTFYYLSLDTSRTADDKRLGGARNIPALGASGTSTGLAGLTVLASTKLGVYYLLACADGANVISESDEADNCLDSTTTVEVHAPDLVVTAVSNPPAMRSPGGSFSVTDTVVNTGNAAAGTSNTQYYLSLNTKKNAIDPRLIGARNALALGVGGQSAGTVTVTIPATITPGSYYLLACGDGLKAVAEGNEGNNCKASATRVSIGG